MGKKKVKLPKGTKEEKVTLDDAVEALSPPKKKTAAKKKKAPAKKKATAKKKS